ncbi:unnamed protein product [Dicrocoelium dendriticum]|nr:unnamed protein product [Dicrocoelium dendriticum]
MPKLNDKSDDEGLSDVVDLNTGLSASLDVLSRALEKLSTGSCSSVCMHAISPPEHYTPGMTYSRWEKKVQHYLRQLSVNQHLGALAGLLSADAFDIVAASNILETFSALRRLLDSPALPAPLRREFHSRYVRELRKMADLAYERASSGERDKRILEKLLEGIPTSSIKREFLPHSPPRSWMQPYGLANNWSRSTEQ